jgi:hypothetical protein
LGFRDQGLAFDLLGKRQKPGSGFRQLIAFGGPFEEPASKAFFQRRDPPSSGGLIDAQIRCYQPQPPASGERKKVLEIVPV